MNILIFESIIRKKKTGKMMICLRCSEADLRVFGCSSSRCSRLSSDGSSLSVKVEVINILSSIEENKALLETGEMWKFQQYKFIWKCWNFSSWLYIFLI